MKHLILLIAFLLITNNVIASSVIVRKLSYPVSPELSLNQSIKLAVSQIQMEVLQETGVFIKSEVSQVRSNNERSEVVKFNQVTGAIAKTKVIEKSFNRKVLDIIVEVEIDHKSLRNYLHTKKRESELSTLSKRLMDLQSDNLGLRDTNASLIEKLKKSKVKIAKLNSSLKKQDLAKASSLKKLLLKISTLEKKLKSNSIDLNKAVIDAKKIEGDITKLKQIAVSNRVRRENEISKEHRNTILEFRSQYDVLTNLIEENITLEDFKLVGDMSYLEVFLGDRSGMEFNSINSIVTKNSGRDKLVNKYIYVSNFVNGFYSPEKKQYKKLHASMSGLSKERSGQAIAIIILADMKTGYIESFEPVYISWLLNWDKTFDNSNHYVIPQQNCNLGPGTAAEEFRCEQENKGPFRVYRDHPPGFNPRFWYYDFEITLINDDNFKDADLYKYELGFPVKGIDEYKNDFRFFMPFPPLINLESALERWPVDFN